MRRRLVAVCLVALFATGCNSIMLVSPTPTLFVIPLSSSTATPEASPIPPSPTPILAPSGQPTSVIAVPTSVIVTYSRPTPAPLGFAPVSSNAEWPVFVQVFSGVEMVLVPAGCFMMGTDFVSDLEEDDEKLDEQPAHQQCFDRPFWMDRTEVTNRQYGTEGLLPGPNRPRDSVNLMAAHNHCQRRGARLPTEKEWEYAARGPDNLLYPWGNTFDVNLVVYLGSSGGQTAEVGSRSDGASWVGALDMAGNLWEWTTTIYAPNTFPYPYNPFDGREDWTIQDSFRVIRGGSYDNEPSFVRAASRKQKHPSGEWYGYVGFRCARDY